MERQKGADEREEKARKCESGENDKQRLHEQKLKKMEEKGQKAADTAHCHESVDLPELKNSDDVLEYLNGVEKLCSAFRWPKELWATQIAWEASNCVEIFWLGMHLISEMWID